MNTSYHYEITECAAYRIHSSKEAEIINFTTISNTSSKKQGVLANYGNLNIKKCNYLNNEDTNNGDAIIWCDTSCTYSNCSFIGNKGNYLFAVKPTFDNCYFNNNDVNQTLKFDFFPETFETGYPLDSFISHYTTDKCSATYFYKKKVSEKRLKMKDIKNIVHNVFKTSFVVSVNISSSK
ncbi:hypothetical protein TVAG_157270 [Trichomonas vaginalis G3]|uniref:Right handed beta helix domain-containing protein n=1 Tax=Trichomonas vaginalis (strain ATCC PRA-98 / G3) TaxID=412133 RepID=A2E9J9_TRIV3|nr:pectin lyase-like family [Trichomonas vaginalis G3]EAY10650.1 hypothetical protein TVAG_157270 [Trichomonas vaginalis G3]KAI5512211.1 pectin lyase-like family [Trichomonas vaginalis G3]|eukprot:XP_001322873.1 hypothetical protein [Trichomonas vaginalis G3]